MIKEDLVVDCTDCGEEFILSAEEKEWFDSKDFHYPKRCKECRDARKEAKRDQTRVAGGNRYQEGHHQRTRRQRSGGDGDNPWLLDDRAYYKIKCKMCHEDAFVPFIPKGPAMCRHCHHENKSRF